MPKCPRLARATLVKATAAGWTTELRATATVAGGMRLYSCRHPAVVLATMLFTVACMSLYAAVFSSCVVVVGPRAAPPRVLLVASASQSSRIFSGGARVHNRDIDPEPDDAENDIPLVASREFTNFESDPASLRRLRFSGTDDAPVGEGIVRIRQNGAKQLPQALIIGVKKGGTRALLEFIRIHPDVRALGPEPHFFDRHYDRGLDWYRRQMPATIEGQITMEKTPSYFITKGVPARIHNMSRNVKLLVVVRDPVTRAISDYTQAVSKRPDLPSFERMAFINDSVGLVDTSWGAIRIGVYAKHLERWLQYFPLEQMHFVSGERLISDPAGEMAKVQRFLGLKCVVTEKHFYFNTTKGFPCLKKPEGSGSPHCLGKTKGRQHPHIDGKVLQRLRDFFRPFNQKFYQMTGQDFGWS